MIQCHFLQQVVEPLRALAHGVARLNGRAGPCQQAPDTPKVLPGVVGLWPVAVAALRVLATQTLEQARAPWVLVLAALGALATRTFALSTGLGVPEAAALQVPEAVAPWPLAMLT